MRDRGRLHQHLSSFLKTLHDWGWGGNPNLSEPALALSPTLRILTDNPLVNSHMPGYHRACWFPGVWLTVSPLADDQAEDG